MSQIHKTNTCLLVRILNILAKKGLGHTVLEEEEAILGDFSPLG